MMDCHLQYVHLCVGSGNSKSSTLSFLFSHSHLNTRVIHRISKCFHTRFILAFQHDSAKVKILDEIDKKWDDVCCGTVPFTTPRSRVTMSVVSKCVCILLCQETAIKS